MPSSTEVSELKVGARASALSRIQVGEVEQELQSHYPNLQFNPVWIETTGDFDQKTSLRAMEKTDFFTKELDELLARGMIDCSIHSAKDLPDPLHSNLTIAAITAGVDSSDSLVLPEGETIESMPEGAVIATSSVRREQHVNLLRDDFTFVDIRGSVDNRLAQLENGRIDGLVVAEAALIRLGLTHYNRVTLPGETTPLQGQLAILVRSDNQPLLALFKCLDSR